MADNIKQCPHDCTQCTMAQQILCAAQLSHDNALTLHQMEERLNAFGLGTNAEKPAIVEVEQKTTTDGGGENRPSID